MTWKVHLSARSIYFPLFVADFHLTPVASSRERVQPVVHDEAGNRSAPECKERFGLNINTAVHSRRMLRTVEVSLFG